MTQVSCDLEREGHGDIVLLRPGWVLGDLYIQGLPLTRGQGQGQILGDMSMEGAVEAQDQKQKEVGRWVA